MFRTLHGATEPFPGIVVVGNRRILGLAGTRLIVWGNLTVIDV